VHGFLVSHGASSSPYVFYLSTSSKAPDSGLPTQGMNQFFYFRYPSVGISGLVPQLLAFPIGRAWARILPNVKIFGLSLNPGPFTVKEHVRIDCATAREY
jgi:hypothetical protein